MRSIKLSGCRYALSAAMLIAAAGTAHAQFKGPSTNTNPYVLPVAPGITTTSIFTVGTGDLTPNGYKMVGIPDGLGAYGNGDGTFTLVMNHEIGAADGIVRAHGSTGAFVSSYNISSADLTVNSGRDLNQTNTSINLWNGAGYAAGTTAYGRLCSADLAAPSAYRFGSLGTDARLFLNGEETGAEGRAFGHVLTGADADKSWQLPRLGRFSWENAIASPFAQQKTVVIGTDDSSPGQVYLYVGDKTDTGNDVDKAGLTNGSLYGVRVTGKPTETRPVPATGRFDLFNKGDVSNTTGASLNTNSNSNQVTNFLRPEDGAWDTRAGKENDFYFVTTDRFNQAGSQGNSRLYRMRFDDITSPTSGGQVDLLVDGFAQGPQMMDNLCIDSLGRILIQEDPGNQDYFAKIWVYDIDSGGLGVVAQHDSAIFTPGLPGFLTRDEESSGIIDAKDILGDGWFLLDVQAHYSIPGELVQGGQLLALYVDPRIIPTPGAAALAVLGGVVVARRRRR